MPTDTKIFRERWPSRLVATAAEDRLNPLIDLIDVVVDHHSHDG